jgi:hypothetical protein
MHRQPLFIFLFFLLLTVATLHSLAITFYLYWIYSWFDNTMHFLGGLLVGLSALWFVFQSGYAPIKLKTYQPVVIAGFAILCVGVGWEIFEYLTGLSIQPHFVADTISDLCMDTLGAGIGWFSFIRLYNERV